MNRLLVSIEQYQRLLKFPLFFLLALTVSLNLRAIEVVIDDFGRQIQLNDDGTWVLLSASRYATSKRGERIKLRPDGSWAVVHPTQQTNAPSHPAILNTGQTAPKSSTHATAIYDQQAALTLLLTDVEILKKKVKTLKSIRTDTRTVFTIRLTNNTQDAIPFSQPNLALIEVKSSGGENFDILSATIADDTLPPNESTTATIIANGSPKWFGVKYLSLQISAGAFGNDFDQLFSRNTDDINTRKIKKF